MGNHPASLQEARRLKNPGWEINPCCSEISMSRIFSGWETSLSLKELRRLKTPGWEITLCPSKMCTSWRPLFWLKHRLLIHFCQDPDSSCALQLTMVLINQMVNYRWTSSGCQDVVNAVPCQIEPLRNVFSKGHQFLQLNHPPPSLSTNRMMLFPQRAILWGPVHTPLAASPCLGTINSGQLHDSFTSTSHHNIYICLHRSVTCVRKLCT